MRFDTPTHLQEWENSPVCQGWITRAEALAELPNVLRVNRDPAKLEAIASTAGANARVGTPQQAAESRDVILLAVQFFILEEVLSAIGSLENKTVTTCMSGLKPDFSGQTIGIATDLKTSVAERLAQLASGANVVEAFNITFAEILASESRQFGNERPTFFIAEII